MLGRYSCEANARKAGRRAGNNDLEPQAVTCVVLRGTAFPVTLRGERTARYYEFGGSFCPEEWEDWERGGIEPSITAGGTTYAVDIQNGNCPVMKCICPH